eukprot:3750962-Pleurochrysis_carterae.AAC.5
MLSPPVGSVATARLKSSARQPLLRIVPLRSSAPICVAVRGSHSSTLLSGALVSAIVHTIACEGKRSFASEAACCGQMLSHNPRQGIRCVLRVRRLHNTPGVQPLVSREPTTRVEVC